MSVVDVRNNLRNVLRGAVSMPNDDSWKSEKAKLVGIIKKKNREIAAFRYELDKLLLQMNELKRSK